MARDLYTLFALADADGLSVLAPSMAEKPLLRQQDIAVGYAPSGMALRHRLIRREPWISERDLRDALMTFALVFTGAVIFLL